VKIEILVFVVILSIILIPQVNFVFHYLDGVYCEQRNEWVREILIMFILVTIPQVIQMTGYASSLFTIRDM